MFFIRIFAVCFGRIQRRFLLEMLRNFLVRIIKISHFAEGKSKSKNVSVSLLPFAL